jgi:large subunit ribosomal protein L25
MSTARPTLAAAPREVTGKKVAHLRQAGRLPAVVYGRDVASTSVSLDAREFDTLRRQTGPNTLIDLTVDGQKPAPVLVHDVQLHRVTRRPLHVDLYVVRMTEELTVDVPLVPEGVAEAVEVLGGTLLHVLESVRVRALPDKLPQSIRYSIDRLATFDDTVHVSELAIPADATLLTDPSEVVAKVLPPRVEVEEAPVAAEEGVEGEAEEGVEGEAAERGAPGAGVGEAPSGGGSEDDAGS